MLPASGVCNSQDTQHVVRAASSRLAILVLLLSCRMRVGVKDRVEDTIMGSTLRECYVPRRMWAFMV